LRELARCRPDLPVVVITGYATLDQAQRAREAGAAAVLAKPFDAGELMQCVRDVLAARTGGKEQAT
jgi:DNA-binding NtrC family response regulator